jgi:hypothetical protein
LVGSIVVILILHTRKCAIEGGVGDVSRALYTLGVITVELKLVESRVEIHGAAIAAIDAVVFRVERRMSGVSWPLSGVGSRVVRNVRETAAALGWRDGILDSRA